MATKLLLSFSVVSLLFIQKVSGYYCDSDKCTVEEYCCGANICCTSYAVWQMWYFWCGLVFFVILLSSCAGFCKYRYDNATIIMGNPYSQLEDGSTNNTHFPANYPGSIKKFECLDSVNYMPSYPPPAYSNGHEKDPNHKR